MVLPVTVKNPGYPGSFGSPFGAELTTTLAANGTLVLPLGNWIVQTGAQDTVILNTGTASSITLVPASSAGFVVSDGQNVEIVANATGGTVTNYLPVLGA